MEQLETLLSDKQILTVDDSPTIRLFLHRLLSSYGAQVDEAATGQEGVDRCTPAGCYDLVLLDLYLPDLDGLAVLERIREDDDVSTIVVLTGVGGIQSALAAMHAGADGYIEKQILTAGSNHSDFLYALQQALEHRAGLVAQKELQEIKADFYAMITHDLRNPAAGILNAVDLLLDERFASLSPPQQEIVEVIQRMAGRLMGLINDYLDYAAIEAGFLRLHLDDVELGEVISGCVQMVGTQAKAKKQSLVFDRPPNPIRAHADGQRLGQVFDNLIGNAIKYTPDDGHIQVQLRREGSEAVFTVSDTGLGISPGHLPALFTKYHRIPGEGTRGIKGTGLGLLIVKEIVTAHEGSVKAESEGIAGKGSTFTVTIPLQGPAVKS
jgi:signal transduction histidine kinase